MFLPLLFPLPYFIFLGVLALVLLARIDSRVAAGPGWVRWPVRVLSTFVAAVCVEIGLLIAGSFGWGHYGLRHDALPAVMTLGLVAGGLSLIIGLILWEGRTAQRLRVVGLACTALAAAVPSTLTILLTPLTVPLLTIGRQRGSTPARSRPRALPNGTLGPRRIVRREGPRAPGP